FLVTRDVDLLSGLARHNAASVAVSITTLDNHLRRVMEPRTSPPRARLAAIGKLSEAGIPTGVMVAPIIPGLTDHEIPAILDAAAKAGALWAGFTVIRLPFGNAALFEQWLQAHFPDRKDKILNRIKTMRGGKLYDAQWGARMRGKGIFADQIETMFHVASRRSGFKDEHPPLSTAAFRPPAPPQLTLF
ncbi:MAG: radical SAM protein, partial [Verrucomicrobia bacterium]|nr:radical SAM protein [Verrucomicrobiota bacterium]